MLGDVHQICVVVNSENGEMGDDRSKIYYMYTDLISSYIGITMDQYIIKHIG